MELIDRGTQNRQQKRRPVSVDRGKPLLGGLLFRLIRGIAPV
jgi:hypothetical protein